MKKLLLIAMGITLVGQAKTYRVDPNGRGDFTTINAAAQVVQDGDEVIVCPGIYREEVRVARGSSCPEKRITFRSEKRGAAIIKGSDVWTNAWTQSNNIWRSKFSTIPNAYRTTISIGPKDTSFAARPVTNVVIDVNTFAERTLGQLFVNGEPMVEVTNLASLKRTCGTWMVAYDGTEIWLHTPQHIADPKDALVEWSVRNRIFGAARRGLLNITVDGFTMEHCANQGPFPQIGALDIRSGNNWIIENCTVRHAKTVGIVIGSETWNGKEILDVPEQDQRLMFSRNPIVRNCTVTDCGLAGITGWEVDGCKVYNNIVERNGKGFYEWPHKYWSEFAGIKFHGCHGVIANNIVRDNEGFGVWCDTMFDNARITGNLIVNNWGNGIFMESSFGHAMIDNNIIAFTRRGSDYYEGDGVYSHNGSCVTVAHNLLYCNAGAGTRFRTIWGKIGKRDYETSENKYLNNIFYKNGECGISINVTNKLSRATISDYNVFVGEWPMKIERFNNGGVTNLLMAHSRYQASNTNALNFTQWQRMGRPLELKDINAVQGTDEHSICVALNLEFASREAMFVSKQFMKNFESFKCPSVSGCDYDYFGNRYAIGKQVQPGPFQFNTLSNQFAALPWQRLAPPHLRNHERDDIPLTKAAAPFRDGETVVFLGDSITHQNRFPRFIEDYYLTRLNERTINFINAGVGGDTASGCMSRFEEDVAAKHPDAVCIMFGMNDSGACDTNVIKRYATNIRLLAQRIDRECPASRIVWMTPSIFDETAVITNRPPMREVDKVRNSVRLAAMAEEVRKLAAERGELCVDFHKAMTAENARRQKVDKYYTLVGPDRVHPQDEGSYFMRDVFLRAQGLDPKVPSKLSDEKTQAILKASVERGNIVSGEVRVCACVRWYLRNRRPAVDPDDFDAVRAYQAKLAAENKHGYFEDRIGFYLQKWPWKTRQIPLERIRLLSVKINELKK